MAKWRSCVLPIERNNEFARFMRKAHIPFEAVVSESYLCVNYLATDGIMAKVNKFLESI